MAAKIDGRVVQITEHGDLVTDIVAAQLSAAPRDERTRVCCDEHETFGLFGPDHDEPPGTLLALLDEGGHLRLQIVGIDASKMLGIRVGQHVTVSW